MPNFLLYICCPPAERRQTEQLLRTAGFVPRWADSVSEALAALELRQSLVLADFADARTVRIVSEIRRLRPATLMLAIADAARPGVREEIHAVGLPVVLHRPLDGPTLSLLFAGVTTRPSGAHAEADDPPGQPIFAESRGMREVVAAVERAVRQGGGVLLCGERGSGRYTLAREIHERSVGAKAPFVYVDCAEGSADELESALFGPETPGSRVAREPRGLERVTQDGALLTAQGGTLFLAQLPDAPARLQGRLARVLRDGEVLTEGAADPTPLRFRPIASSSPSWDSAVAEGGLRVDLVTRIAATRIEVPALRERREDIPQLAACLLHSACAAHRVPLKTIDPPALALLTALPWRGNGRELRELLDQLVSRSSGPAIRLEDVLGVVTLDGFSRRTVPYGTLREARARFERDYITAVVRHHRGRIGEAARTLGIQRTNLYRKMRSLKVSWRSPNATNGAAPPASHDGSR